MTDRLGFFQSDFNLGLSKQPTICLLTQLPYCNQNPHLLSRCDITWQPSKVLLIRKKPKDFKLANSTCQASNGPTIIILSSSPCLPPSFPLNSPHSNNCPPLSRKTLVPLENSITRLHKRFKIMVLSLCGERECSWPQLKQQQTLRHSGTSGRYCIIAY